MVQRFREIFSRLITAWRRFLGVDDRRTGHVEKLISGLGAGISIFVILLLSRALLGESATFIVVSMGASAVLLFAVPGGILSQPWPLLAGNTFSAAVGVTSAMLIAEPVTAAAVAVCGAVLIMYYTRSIHPPGGATALVAVIGGPAYTKLHYMYVIAPVFLNAMIIFMVAVLFNSMFAWRRYPSSWRYEPERQRSDEQIAGVNHEDLEYALRQWNSYLDLSEQDLIHLFALARQHTSMLRMPVEHIQNGRCYSNGCFGSDWEVRMIVDDYFDKKRLQDTVIYKIVAGVNRRGSGSCSREQFAAWAKHQVARNENSWQRINS